MSVDLIKLALLLIGNLLYGPAYDWDRMLAARLIVEGGGVTLELAYDPVSEFPHLKSRLPTLWTNSYFLSTVGGAPLAVIKRYIENQRNV